MFQGGEDIITPQELVDERTLALAINYDPVLEGGYARIKGYERFDGQTSPSSESDSVTREALRANINAVPGSGPVRGVWVYNNKVYAFRDNAGATECLMYEATGSGWNAITHPTLAPGGRYEFRNFNFLGTTTGRKMFGVSGVHQAFQFDGTTMTLIATGVLYTDDKPEHLSCHNMQLWLSFPGGSLQHSSTGDPTTWSSLWNAGEIGIGEEITGLRSIQAAGLLVVFGADRTSKLYGRTHSEYQLIPHNEDVGALPWSIQPMGDVYFLDRLGITSLTQTQQSGDMRHALLSTRVDPYVKSLRTLGAVNSCDIRAKNLYRVFQHNQASTQFSTMLVGPRGPQGFSRGNYPFGMFCCERGYINGVERVFAGSTDGYVYELESGNSYDGVEIDSSMKTQALHLGSPHIRKHWRHVWLNAKSAGAMDLQFSAEYDYADPETPKHIIENDGFVASGGFWDEANWSEFVWDGRPFYPMVGDIHGEGANVVLRMRSSVKDQEPHHIYGVRLHYSMGRELRP